MEQWKQIELDGVSLNFEVSTLGRVRHRLTHHIKTQHATRSGYRIVNLFHPGVRKLRMIQVGRLVANAFLRPRRKGEQIEHKDQDRTNNRLANLMIVDQSTNIRRSYKMTKRGNGRRRYLGEQSYQLVKRLWQSGKYSQVQIGNMLGICNSTVSKIINGKIRPCSHVKEELTLPELQSE